MDKLDSIHDLLADLMLAELEAAKEANMPLAAADKAAIARFLKDNGRTKGASKTNDQEEMEAQLRAMREARQRKASAVVADAQAEILSLYDNGGTLQ